MLFDSWVKIFCMIKCDLCFNAKNEKKGKWKGNLDGKEKKTWI